MLRIQLLGGFRLTLDDQPVTGIDAPRLQSLLAYLLLHQDMPPTRQQLAFLLWPDSTEAQARTNLRKGLHLLREILPEVDRFLSTDSKSVGWRPDALFTLDVLEFERAAADAHSSTSLQGAIHLYRGDLLPGCYDDWILPERERLREMFIQSLERLITLLEEARDYSAALGFGQRLLRHDPLREETYRRLMRLHALSGDRTGALRVYQACVAVMKREFDADVSPATQETYQAVTKTEAVSAPWPSATALPQPQPHHLPIQLTSFVGREREVADVRRLLGQTRLLTLTGPGGCGKTRLALQVAGEAAGTMKDGARWVEFASLSDPALLPQAVASVLGVREQPGHELLGLLTSTLQPKELLLILDNCEHLLEACAHLAESLLRSCAQLKIVATSRERLNVAGESVWPVPSLSLPSTLNATPDTLLQSEAICLFVERAGAVLPTFDLTPQHAAAVAQICQRLDGIPLAIELAAARVRMLTPNDIAARLDDLFRLLTGGSPVAPPRQQTLRATMDWSYRLLAEHEQVLFRRLSVFAGGWSLEAAEHVCVDAGFEASLVLEVLSQLIDKSLVLAEAHGGEARYRILETIRQYAQEKLQASGEAELLRERHMQFFLRFAEAADPKVTGPEQIVWLNRLDVEHDNLRAALRWALDNEKVDASVRLVIALRHFWQLRDYLSEGHAWAVQTVAKTSAADRTALRGRALNVLLRFTVFLGDYQTSHSLVDESLTLFRELGDQWGMADTLKRSGNIAWRQSNYSKAQAELEQALVLFREVEDPLGIADTLHILGHVAMDQGLYPQAGELFRDSLSRFRETGHPEMIATLVGDVGLLAYLQADLATARSCFEENLMHSRQIFNKDGMARSLDRLGDLARCEGDDAHAEALYNESLAMFRQIGHKTFVGGTLHNLGYVALHRGEYPLAIARFCESLKLLQDLGDRKGMVECLMGLAGVAVGREHPERAARLFGAAEALRESVGAALWTANRIEYERNLAALRGQLDEDALADQWVHGRALTLEQAVEYALEKI
jgi:predicted ATPase/DNA-binding SARP family transcriptional activator